MRDQQLEQQQQQQQPLECNNAGRRRAARSWPVYHHHQHLLVQLLLVAVLVFHTHAADPVASQSIQQPSAKLERGTTFVILSPGPTLVPTAADEVSPPPEEEEEETNATSVTISPGDRPTFVPTEGDDDNVADQENDAEDDDDDDYEITSKDIASAVLPKITAFLSILGSSCIMAEVIAEQRKRQGKAVNRILFSMSVSDILFSLAWFFSTWAAPSETSDYIWMPLGTTATCTAQAFFVQLGYAATPMFNISLSWYYLLMVKYNWHEQQLKRMDPWVHGGIWALALTLAIIPIPLDLYNNSWEVCWIDAFPMECEGDECTRGGDLAWIFALILTIFPPWICLILSVVFMGMIYGEVRRVETVAMRGSVGTTQLSTVTRAKSRLVGIQAMWYIAAFFVVFVPDAISVILYYVDDIWYYYLDLFAYTILPFQGFLNFCVFLYRREKMHSRYGQWFRYLLCCGKVSRQPGKSVLRSTRRTSNLTSFIRSHIGHHASALTGSHVADEHHHDDDHAAASVPQESAQHHDKGERHHYDPTAAASPNGGDDHYLDLSADEFAEATA